MNDALLYFLKVNIAISIFYLFYRLVFYNDTLWTARRLYLIVAAIVAVVYPFISLANWLEKQETMQVILSDYTANLPETFVQPNAPAPIDYETVAFYIYGLVAFGLLIRMGIQLASILRWKLVSKKMNLQGVDILNINRNIAPFSFFNLIFINPALHNEQETKQILAHEKTHARQWHSLDVLLSELLTICCWINPAAWLMKREIRQNLEFLADNSVLQLGFDSKNYQYHLLQLSYQIPDVNMANKFNVLPLKKRIMKMNQQKTSKAGLLKYSLIVPLALALVVSSNIQSLAASTREMFNASENQTREETIQQSVTKKETNKKALDVVEQMPEYPGGDKALMEFLGKNIKYPAGAIQNNIQGKVILRFVVNEHGKVSDTEILRSVSPDLDKEAIRVVNTLPTWIPGKQNGKNVAVWYTLPISFKMDGDKKSKKKSATTITQSESKKIEAEARKLDADARKIASDARKIEAQARQIEAEARKTEAESRKIDAQARKQEAEIRKNQANSVNTDENNIQISNINGVSKALIVIDGIISTKTDLDDLKRERIKEINILKDKSATALYGEKGRNGVMIITTK